MNFSTFDDNFFETSKKESINIKISNPFFVNITRNSNHDILKYTYALGMCKKNECNVSQSILSKIYEKQLKQSELKIFKDYYTLVKVSINLLENKYHNQTYLVLDKSILSMFNHSSIDLNEKEIVVLLFELTENLVNIYNLMYESSYNIDIISKANTLYQYFNCDLYKNDILNKLMKIYLDINDTDYWTLSSNCNINLSNKFSKRLLNNKFPNEIIKSEKFYFNSLDLYKIDDKLSLTKEDVENIFNSINDKKLLFNTFNTFLLSKKYCHFVINNINILKIVQSFFKSKLIVLYNYIFGYAWLYMYLEEYIMKTKTTKNNRYVFDINTAHELPFFPYCAQNIQNNPYCILPINENILNFDSNGLPMIFDNNCNNYGINNLDEFIIKLNIFTTGKINKNIFDGLETKKGTNIWKYFAITGSIIPACSQKYNKLIDKKSFEYDLNKYFNEYYFESNINVICNSKSIFDFIDNVYKLINIIKTNLDDNNIEKNIESNKSQYIIVHKTYIEKKMSDIGDLNYIINNIKSKTVIQRFYMEYFDCKVNKNNYFRSFKNENLLYEDFYKILDDINIIIATNEIKKDLLESDSNIYIYLNDILPIDQKVSIDNNILILKIEETLKFKIKSSNMNHNIEISRAPYDDYFSYVSTFHLPCIRGYYDGDNVYLLPSCITSLMTYTNIDYKYYFGDDVIDNINKYRYRGFRTIINNQEKIKIDEYNKQHLNICIDYSKIENPKYVLTLDDYYNYFKIKYGYTIFNFNFFKLKVIDGYIIPLKKWVIEAAYDELFI